MTSRTATITKTVVTRSWHDIDPKVAAGAAVAALTTLVLGTLLFAGRIGAGEFSTTAITVWGVVVASYLKRSADTGGAAAFDAAKGLVATLAPVVTASAPEAAPVVAAIEDGIAEIEKQLQPDPPTRAYKI